MRSLSSFLLLVLALGCGDDDSSTPTADGGTTADASEPESGLRSGAPVTFAEVYTATRYTEGGYDRAWLPKDLSVHPDGQLWVVQQMERDGSFTDEDECTERGLGGAANDCVGQQGSTVAITDPAALEPASDANGRVRLVVDANSWHFMRRPSGIAFGAEALTLDPSDPGAEETGITAPVTFTNTFATCHEHFTGNPTDTAPYIGPTVWTADPAIYDGTNGSFSWSNGSHLDMVHATQYCMGIAYEGENKYWLFDGANGFLDYYDFGKPHHPGHYDHSDFVVERYLMPEGDELARVPGVPSNLHVDGRTLWVADTGNGRVLAFDLDSPTTQFGTYRTMENTSAPTFDGLAFATVLDSAVLGAEWGGAVEPSGLAQLPDGTLAVASHATGHVTLFDADGTVVRTIDSGTGAGLGGMTQIDGTLYVVQMEARQILRVDVAE
ncbi:MAG: hypothetical protein CMN30_34315 [Sandaracinus sp.]|nr:hypothetical protein [Sandaracinus sp.]|tara:strand:+ start:140 stop:1456 length:1317 start_codon:yes stop_codon:yes gene_type:complete